MLGVAQLQMITHSEVEDDADWSETVDAERESSRELESQNLIESYWNWFFFAMNAGALCGYTFASWLCQVCSGNRCCIVYSLYIRLETNITKNERTEGQALANLT